MSIESGHFEHLEHQTTTGEVLDIPLYLGEHERLTAESQVLLDAVNLLAPNLNKFDKGLEGLLDRVGEMVSNPAHKGIIIEDDEGGGSVRIDGETTRVSIRGQGVYSVSTPLVFDMIYTWAEYNRDRQNPKS